MHSRPCLALLALLLLTACSVDSAGTFEDDAAMDAALPDGSVGDAATHDAAMDAASGDGTVPQMDAAMDAELDAAMDAELDAAMDAELDAAMDAELDAGPDECMGMADGTPCGASLCENTCANGACVAVAVVCADAADPCRDRAACVPATGQCDYGVDQGDACDDGEVCSEGDVCDASGICVGTDVDQQSVTGCEDTLMCISGTCLELPIPEADAFQTAGNTARTLPTSVLANDTEPLGMGLTAVAASGPTNLGGSFSIIENGTVSYTPPVGATSMVDTFSYEAVTPDGRRASAQVQVTLVGRYWYVDNSAASGGDGTNVRPFSTLKSVEGVSQSDDVILVFRGDGTTLGYDQGVTLRAGQRLIGQGDAYSVLLSDGPIVVMPAGSSPRLTGPLAAVTLDDDTRVRSIDIVGPVTHGVVGSGVGGDVRLENVSVEGAQTAAVAIGHAGAPDLSLSITGLTAQGLSAAADGVAITASGGTASATLSDVVVSGAMDTALSVSGTNGAVLAVTAQSTRLDGASQGMNGIDCRASTRATVRCDLTGVTSIGHAQSALIVYGRDDQSVLFATVDGGRYESVLQTVMLATRSSALNDAVDVRARVENATIRSTSSTAVSGTALNGSSAGRLDVTLTNNDLTTESLFDDTVRLRATDANTLCANVGGNVVTAVPMNDGIVMNAASGPVILEGTNPSPAMQLTSTNVVSSVFVDAAVTTVDFGTCRVPN